MKQPTHTHDNGPRPVVLTQVESRLPIPDDVIVVESEDVPPWFTGVSSVRRRVILLKAGLEKAERAFTLAHELAHVLLEHKANTAANEAAADELATQLLAEASQ